MSITMHMLSGLAPYFGDNEEYPIINVAQDRIGLIMLPWWPYHDTIIVLSNIAILVELS